MEEVTIIIDNQPHKVTKPVADFIVKLGKERNEFEDLATLALRRNRGNITRGIQNEKI